MHRRPHPTQVEPQPTIRATHLHALKPTPPHPTPPTPPHHPTTQELVNDISEVYRSKIQTQLPEYDRRRHTVVEIKKGDAFKGPSDGSPNGSSNGSPDGSSDGCDWTDSDVVFSNSTCFTKTMWRDYSNMTQQLKPGSFIVTTTGRFSSTPWLECVEASRLRQGWGSCGLFIHRRLPEGLSDPRTVL